MTKLNNFVRRYTSISAVIDILRRRELPLLDPQSWDDRNDRYFMALYKEKKRLGGLYGLCAAQCSETYHHWCVFTGTADGACIEIRREPLEAAVGKTPGMRCGAVDYLRLAEVEALTTKEVDRLPFIKRLGFAAEEEYRIIAETGEAQGPVISIDFPLRWINRIYLNPWLAKPIAESVIETLKAVPGCGRIHVGKSLLIESARWKRAGDKVAGRKQPATTKLKKGSSKK
jgi:hypothetical protein